MTSRNSSLKISRMNFKKRFPFLVICFLLCFFLMTVVRIFECIGIQQIIEMDHIQGIPDWARRQLAEGMQVGNGLFISITAVEAILLALSGWSWNNSISKVDFYKALPVKGSKRFAYINLNNLYIFLITFAGNLVLSNIVIAVNGMYSVATFTNSVFAFITCTLAFVALYGLATIAEMLTGNLLLAVGFTIMLWFYEPAIKFMLYFLKSVYYKTFFAGIAGESTTIVGGITSPIATYFEIFAAKNIMFNNMMADSNLIRAIVILILQCVVYNYIAYVLYIKRKSYAGNSHITYSSVKTIVKCAILIPMIVTFMVAFTSILDAEKYDLISAIFGLISGAIIGQIVLQYTFEGDFKCVVKGLKSLAFSCVVAVLIFTFYKCDLAGFDKYIPNKDEIKAVSIYHPNAREANSTMYGTQGTAISGESFRLSNYEFEDENLINAVLNNVKDAIEENQIAKESDNWYGDFEQMSVCYTLNNGQKVCREYLMDIEKCRDIMTVAYSSDEYRKSLNVFEDEEFMAILRKSFDRSLHVGFEAHNRHQMSTEINKADIDKVIEAYKLDVESRPADIIMNELSVMSISINANDREDGNVYGDYSYAYADMPVYSCDVNTLALAEKYGIVPIAINADNIAKLVVNKDVVTKNAYGIEYEEYVGEFTPENPLFDEIMENVNFSASFSFASGYFLREDAYYIEVVYSDGTNDSLKFYRNRVPEGLDEQLEEVNDSYDYGAIKEW